MTARQCCRAVGVGLVVSVVVDVVAAVAWAWFFDGNSLVSW